MTKTTKMQKMMIIGVIGAGIWLLTQPQTVYGSGSVGRGSGFPLATGKYEPQFSSEPQQPFMYNFPAPIFPEISYQDYSEPQPIPQQRGSSAPDVTTKKSVKTIRAENYARSIYGGADKLSATKKYYAGGYDSPYSGGGSSKKSKRTVIQAPSSSRHERTPFAREVQTYLFNKIRGGN